MHFTDQPKRKRKSASDALDAMIDCVDIVDDFGDVIIEIVDPDVVIPDEQKVRERGLYSLDLGREQCFLANVHVQEYRSRWKDLCQSVQLANASDSSFVDMHEWPDVKGWHWRKRLWHIGAYRFSSGCRLDKPAKSLVVFF